MSNINKIRYNGEYYDISSNNNYSTEEQVIGTWIDGKPLYRKVFNLGQISGTINPNHNISNLDIIVNSYGGFTQQGAKREPIPKITGDVTWDAVIQDITDTEFNISFGSNIGTATNVYIILEYTKTTD